MVLGTGIKPFLLPFSVHVIYIFLNFPVHLVVASQLGQTTSSISFRFRVLFTIVRLEAPRARHREKVPVARIDFLNVSFPGSLYRSYVTYRSDRLECLDGRGTRKQRDDCRRTREKERERETKTNEGGKKDTIERERGRCKFFRVRATAYGLYRGYRICMPERLKGCYGNAVSLLT